jgi:hypothetical protein
MKRVLPEPGSIRVGQTRKYSSYPNEDGWETIPAWSRGKSPWKDLSPFFIRVNGGASFETWWQSWKVYETLGHTDPKTGDPNEAWQKWHDGLVFNPVPIRRPAGKAIPVYAWWDGRRLGVVEARKEIYIPTLQRLYRAHPTYQKLLEKVRGGQSIILVEPDGPDISMFPEGFDVNLEMLEKLQDVTRLEDFPHEKAKTVADLSGSRYVPYGHGYVLALTILQDLLH